MEKVPYKWVKTIMNRYFFASTFVADSIVLDIASNEGYGSLYMTKSARFVVGCDISKNYCITAKKASRDYKNCEFIVCDAKKLPFKNRVFDVVVSLETIEHLDDSNSFLSECARTMKSYSTMICSTPNRKATSMLFKKPLNPHHVREFCVTEFVSLLEHYFKSISLYGQEYSLTIVTIMKQLTSKITHFILPFTKRREPGKLMKTILKCVTCRARDKPKMTMPYNSYERFLDKEYEVTIFKENILHTPYHIICVASEAKCTAI